MCETCARGEELGEELGEESGEELGEETSEETGDDDELDEELAVAEEAAEDGLGALALFLDLESSTPARGPRLSHGSLAGR